MATSVKPVPEGMHTLTPHLLCDDAAAAIDFYVRGLGATELARLPGPGGKVMHALLQIGDSKFMLADAFPERGAPGARGLGGSPVYLHLYLDDVDAGVSRAAAAGAKVLMPPADMFWGDRYAQIEDPSGHRWSLATHVRDLTPEQVQAGMANANCG